MEEVSAEVIAKTQKTLGKYVQRPPLTDKLLRKPPFRFLHDIVSAVIKETGFLKGLYADSELLSDNVKDRDGKIAFLNKLITAVKAISGVDLKVRASKVIAGMEPTETNILLQTISMCLDKKLNSKEYVLQLKAKAKEQKKEALAKKAPKDKDSVKSKKEGGKSSDRSTKAGGKKDTLSKSSKESNASSKSNETLPKKSPKNATTSKKAAGDAKSKDSVKLEGKKSTSSLMSSKQGSMDGGSSKNSSPKTDLDNEPSPKTKASPKSSNQSKPSPKGKSEKTSPKDEIMKNKEVASPKTEEVNNAKSAEPKSARLKSARGKSGDKENVIAESVGAEKVPNSPKVAKVPSARAMEAIPSTSSANNLSARSSKDEVKPPEQPKHEEKKVYEPPPPASRPKSSLRPPSVRPASARPGAPRLRPESAIAMKEMVPLGKINVIVESFDGSEGKEDDEEETVVIQNVNEEPPDTMFIEKSLDIPTDKGHLVEQILEQIQGPELEEQINLEHESIEIIDYLLQGHKNRDATTREIQQLRGSIQSLTKTANPLGKLMSYLHEDVEAMHSELEAWTNMKRQYLIEIAKQKRVNAESNQPLKNQLQEIEESIKKQRDEIAAVKFNILRNEEKIRELLAKQIQTPL